MPNDESAELKRRVEALESAIRDLEAVQDESALNEIALIATLQSLLPGFSQTFERLRIGAEKQTSDDDAATLQAVRALLKKRVN
jgi:hypothetical protein